MYERTDQVFDGRTLNELIAELTRAAPAASGLSQVAPAYDRLAGVLDQMHARLRAATAAAAAGHQGAAAQASQEHTAQQATFAVDGTTEARVATGSVTTQSQHYSDTVARMPQPAEEPALWRVLTVPVDPAHSYLVEKGGYEARRQAAVDAMNTYQTASNDTVQRFALFTEPTVAPAGLGPASGGNPRLPGGGAPATGPSPTGADRPTGQPQSTGEGGVPVVPQQMAPPAGVALPGRGTAPRETTPARPTPGLTPLRPRAAVPGAWSDGGSAPREAGRPSGPGGRPGPGTVAEGAGTRPATTGRGAGVGSGVMPMGAGAGRGRGDEERRRPPWLLEDDPEAAFGPMPPHAPPVIEASDPWERR